MAESELPTMESLVQELASCRLDSSAASKRNASIQQAEAQVQQDMEALASLEGFDCRSEHAVRRVARLYCVALAACPGQAEETDVILKLCRGLCHVLNQTQSTTLVAACRDKLRSCACQTFLKTSFQTIAQEESLLFGPALVLGSALDSDDEKAHLQWMEVLLQRTLGSSNQNDTANNMQLLQPFLSTTTQTEWDTLVLPTLSLKLKAAPERALGRICSLVEGLSGANLNASTTLQSSELLPVVLKQLKSTKAPLRTLAQSLCVALARLQATAVVATAVASHLTSVSVVEARQGVYQVLRDISKIGTNEEEEVTATESVLASLTQALTKETKAPAQEAGVEALVGWMVRAKQQQSGGGGTATEGYNKALDYLRAPLVVKANIVANDVICRLGCLVTRVHPDVLESILLDLWNPKVQQGIQKVVEGASKKHASSSSSSSTLPPAEGLVAVYMSLVHALGADRQNPQVSAGVAKVLKSQKSLLYGPSMTEAIAASPLVGQLLPQTIALYVKLMAKQEESTELGGAAARALACSVAHASATAAEASPTDALLASVQTVLTYQPRAAETLADALADRVNQLALDYSKESRELNATRQARELFGPIMDEPHPKLLNARKGQYSPTGASHSGVDTQVVRRVAQLLARHATTNRGWAKAVLLMHVGSSLKTSGKQRTKLIANTLELLAEVLLPRWQQQQGEADAEEKGLDSVAEAISAFACRHQRDSNEEEENTIEGGGGSDSMMATVSDVMHKSALSLVSSLGGIACSFDPAFDDPNDEEMKPYVIARKLCTDGLASKFAAKLLKSLESAKSLSESDMDLYKSPPGIPFQKVSRDGSAPSSTDPKQAGGKKGRAGNEDEEWERQLKKELAQKKKLESTGEIRASLSPEEKKLVASQDQERKKIASLLGGDLTRSLDAIVTLCLSDIEVGNASLPQLSDAVLRSAVCGCVAITSIASLGIKVFDTLKIIASCVYEIDESHASSIARALVVCCKEGTGASEGQLDVIALPSPCESAAIAISEMDEFLDRLSGASFAFTFPILRAALIGARTTPGTEGALRLLSRHTEMLAGEEFDPVVAPLRKDMAATVLQLLTHDRSQTFVDPSPVDALVACYKSESLEGKLPFTTSELAPLLDERGALGGRNCRLASMVAIGSIATDRQRQVKNNPLIENRVWLNCFDKNESVQESARDTWRIITCDTTGGDHTASLSSPSTLYAMPLLPLLSQSDPAIASAASDALAHAMGRHPGTVQRTVLKLCGNFIESFPTEFDGDKQSSGSSLPAPLPSKLPQPPPPKKKPAAKISTGLPKKKTTKKPASALSIAGIGQPKKKSTKKKASTSALLKPKEERTFDKDVLESQFRSEKKATEAEKDTPRKIEIRLGVLKAMAALTNTSAEVKLDLSTTKTLTGFLVAYGLADGNESVRESARNALRDVVASYGDSDDAIAFLLPLFETVLKTGVADETCLGELSTEKLPRDVSASDRRKEGVVVALGSVALHLKGEENAIRIDSTIDMLLSALKTPSESVQSSVAACLAKLMKKGNTQERIEVIFGDLMRDCLRGDTLASRRGAAYGLSAAVKGSGIASLKKYEIVKQLENACASGASNAKEGSLFAIELLSNRLGLLFEPYVIVLLPSLLRSFSDSSDYVRAAADHTAAIIMSKLSAHGVKLVMPAVLKAFEDPAWRTKQASIRMLGSMSQLAPKQLASALPKVVPQLTEAFSDTHPKVKSSAEEALNEISKVVKNPEISSISSILLKALTDPAEYTVKALEALIGTEFLHAIDAPSLALIVPVLHRGLRDRAATTKRYGALIAGNICTMINDPRDFVPYLPILMPDLKIAVLDPIPDVRSTSAKALGSLTRGLGEETLSDLRPWLIKEIRDEDRSSAERSGAAQGLTEVLVACGAEVVETVMLDEILPLRSHPQASTREGVLWVIAFLPTALGQSFTPLIDPTLPALLGGLSDDSEPVRDVAMRAGRILIRSHGKVHVDKILPSIEAGLTDEDYRIRVSSLTLLGDLLSTIGGTTVIKGDGETQDDIRRAERAQAQIALTLGSETRKRVLSRLYMTRSDTVAQVRQSAVQVWKTVVSVTARTLRDILKVLVGQIVDALASGHPEKTQVAGRCLGDIVNKLGDSVLPEIIPVLRNSLYTGDKHTRQGVCVGLTEVIKCSTKDQILRFIEIIVRVVKDALCDEDEGVRQMAASCFQSLHSVVGNRAMDEIVPSLLVALDQENEDEESRARSLNGLIGILSIRSRELLPYILPRLICRPISTSHAEALSGVAVVTGATIHMHFNSIIPALISELAEFGKDIDDEESKREAAVRESARSVCRSVDEVGVNWMVGEIASKCNSDKFEVRKEGCWMFGITVEERKDKQDFYEQIPIILRELLYRFNDENPAVLKAAHSAFMSLSKHVPAEELVKHIEFIRNLIASIVSDARRRKGGVGDGEFLLPGFNMPKGLEPLLPIYQRGILYGDANIREVSASGLGELIELTSSKFLAGPLIIKITGPLLRIVGDRNPSAVKIAILRTLGLVLVKGGPALRAFVPQFQTTFVKALSDPSRQVRVEAIGALALLMPLSTRVDPLLKELVSGSLGKSSGAAETAGVAAVQTATLEALAVVLKKGGKKAKLPDSVPSSLDAGKELLRHKDEGVREGAAKVVGAACELLGVEVTLHVIQSSILGQGKSSSDIRHGIACACHRILASKVGPEIEGVALDMLELILALLKDDKSGVKEAACVAIGASIGSAADSTARLRDVEPVLLGILRNNQELMEVHQAMGRGLCLALHLCGEEDRVAFMGKTLMDACLALAMSGSQRVQFAFNDVLWMALNVPNGEAGLEAYMGVANFDNSKAMKSLFAKVLTRIKTVEVED